MKTISYSAQAHRQLAAVASDLQDRIEAKLGRYALLGEGDAEAMARPGGA